MAPPNLDATSNTSKPYTILPSADKEDGQFDKREIKNMPSNDSPSQETEANENDTLVEKVETKKLSLTDNEKDEDICSDDIEVVVPPDGGWGWVIVFASFMCNMVVDGIIFSFGTFLSGISEEFGVTKGQVTLVGSLMSGSYLIAGPFASAIANKFGFRLVAIVGAVLGAVAFALSYFATSVEYLCITYGLIGGKLYYIIIICSKFVISGYYLVLYRVL